jgi:hypothetical protein
MKQLSRSRAQGGSSVEEAANTVSISQILRDHLTCLHDDIEAVSLDIAHEMNADWASEVQVSTPHTYNMNQLTFKKLLLMFTEENAQT